ncbi:hypothetical protein [Paenibacillus sp. YN15]|uniref:hypothetical protein n=1 Tax=Paenibacillus sp. YN15 TaxID=1742774 RepID=UPI0011BEE266|nr:hypothetical protein [Paenibacillus sp. YN15]
MLTVQGLDKAIRQMAGAAANRRFYNRLRYDVAEEFMDACAAGSAWVSPRLAASFQRASYQGKKEWVFEVKGPYAMEAGTTVPNAAKLGAPRIMGRALSKTAGKLPAQADRFFHSAGKAAGFDVSKQS